MPDEYLGSFAITEKMLKEWSLPDVVCRPPLMLDGTPVDVSAFQHDTPAWLKKSTRLYRAPGAKVLHAVVSACTAIGAGMLDTSTEDLFLWFRRRGEEKEEYSAYDYQITLQPTREGTVVRLVILEWCPEMDPESFFGQMGASLSTGNLYSKFFKELDVAVSG
jgi:hypothetical protein